jgi:hypothetical protein
MPPILIIKIPRMHKKCLINLKQNKLRSYTVKWEDC